MKIEATKIIVHRVEGWSHECKPRVFEGKSCWLDTEVFLWSSALTAPVREGYDKCQVTITFADGFVTATRYDLYHPDSGKFQALAEHVRREWELYAGRRLPARMKRESWERFIKDYNITPIQWVDRCERYAIGGAP